MGVANAIYNRLIRNMSIINDTCGVKFWDLNSFSVTISLLFLWSIVLFIHHATNKYACCLKQPNGERFATWSGSVGRNLDTGWGSGRRRMSIELLAGQTCLGRLGSHLIALRSGWLTGRPPRALARTEKALLSYSVAFSIRALHYMAVQHSTCQ